MSAIINFLRSGILGIWNILVVFGIGAAVFSAFTGRDISGTPTSIANFKCADISDSFKESQIEVNYQLHEIQKVDDLTEKERSNDHLRCTGLAYLKGAPSTLVYLNVVEEGKEFSMEIGQATPSDFDCNSLALEVQRKFSDATSTPSGGILSLNNVASSSAGTGTIQCRGQARYTRGIEQAVSFSYDGQVFQVEPEF